MLAPSAYLASAASTATLVLKLLPSFLYQISDVSTPNALVTWQSAVEPPTLAPVDTVPSPQSVSANGTTRAASVRRRCCWTRRWKTEKDRAFVPVSRPHRELGYKPSRYHRLGREWTMTSSGWRWVCISALTCASHTPVHAVFSWMPVARTGWPASEALDAGCVDS